MRCSLSIPFLALVVLRAPAQPLDEQQIHVATTLETPGVELAARVQISGRPDGARAIEVELTNHSDRDVALTNAEVELPWVTRAGTDFNHARNAIAVE